jgi:transcriptional/translational regulatory protein YebC/TACO1
VREAVRKLEIEPVSAAVAMVPFEFVRLTGKEAQSMLRLMDVLEDHEDIQHVWSNFDIDEKEIEASLS